MTCINAQDPQLTRLAQAIAQRVGAQRFHVWFNNSTRLDLKNEGLEIAVPNDFISEWIGRNFTRPIEDASQEVLGCRLPIHFAVMPQLFEPHADNHAVAADAIPEARPADGALLQKINGKHYDQLAAVAAAPPPRVLVAPVRHAAQETRQPAGVASTSRLRHSLDTFVVGPGNQLAFNAAACVAEYPGTQYNPLFLHGACGLGKTHLLQGICRLFARHHPAKRWVYLTGEEFTNEFLVAMKTNKMDQFRRKMRDLDLLVIDDVHFLAGKRATQEEFLHTFNSIEAMGRQIVIASDNHPKMIDEFGESLVNRFVSGMVVRIDPPNHAMRCQILHLLAARHSLSLPADVVDWIARRVTQNVRELEGAVTRISAHVTLTGRTADLALVQESLVDLDKQLISPLRPENILQAVCNYFGIDMKDLMSGRRQRTISLARSVAMHLIRKTAKLSFPEIGMRMGKRNHSTVISACRRMERAISKSETLVWTSAVGERTEEANELVQRLEELSRSIN
ncbi:MAG: chromosomal replication initiator protein DnaA [Tepidisphaeraceae bacterium]